MLAKILRDGTLLIEAENGLEGYALGKWCDENKHKLSSCKFVVRTEKEEDEKEA